MGRNFYFAWGCFRNFASAARQAGAGSVASAAKTVSGEWAMTATIGLARDPHIQLHRALHVAQNFLRE
jgi:hypothetical protein